MKIFYLFFVLAENSINIKISEYFMTTRCQLGDIFLLSVVYRIFFNVNNLSALKIHSYMTCFDTSLISRGKIILYQIC